MKRTVLEQHVGTGAGILCLRHAANKFAGPASLTNVQF